MRPERRSDRGETLLELLVALSIMSIAVVTIIGAIATSVRLSDVHRRQTIARGYLTEFAETIASSMVASPSGYVACAATNGSTYDGIYSTPSPSTYVDDVFSVEYWNGSTFVSSGCTAANDSGVQRLTLTVVNGTAITEKVQLIIRRPCRPGETPACP
jgi:type II secretory pathway pseudopilin PulG